MGFVSSMLHLSVARVHIQGQYAHNCEQFENTFHGTFLKLFHLR